MKRDAYKQAFLQKNWLDYQLYHARLRITGIKVVHIALISEDDRCGFADGCHGG